MSTDSLTAAGLAREVRAEQQAEDEAEAYRTGLSTHRPETAAEAGSQSAQAVADVESSRRPTGLSRAGAGPRRSDYTDQHAAVSTEPLTAHDVARARESLARLAELAVDSAAFQDRAQADVDRVAAALAELERLQEQLAAGDRAIRCICVRAPDDYGDTGGWVSTCPVHGWSR